MFSTEFTLESHGRVVLPFCLCHRKLLLSALSLLPTGKTENDVKLLGGEATNRLEFAAAVRTPSQFGLPKNVHLDFSKTIERHRRIDSSLFETRAGCNLPAC
jgi:hypothetical protein